MGELLLFRALIRQKRHHFREQYLKRKMVLPHSEARRVFFPGRSPNGGKGVIISSFSFEERSLWAFFARLKSKSLSRQWNIFLHVSYLVLYQEAHCLRGRDPNGVHSCSIFLAHLEAKKGVAFVVRDESSIRNGKLTKYETSEKVEITALRDTLPQSPMLNGR